jgi:hypothetical protein
MLSWCLWPMWIPIVCMTLHHHRQGTSTKAYQLRFYSLACLVVMGLGLSIFLTVKLFDSDSFRVSTYNNHITYRFWLTSENDYFASTVVYLLCTIVPWWLVQRIKFLWFVGVSIGASAIASWMLYTAAFPSTWCFFAAWLSMEGVAIKIYDVYMGNTRGKYSGTGTDIVVAGPSDNNRTIQLTGTYLI